MPANDRLDCNKLDGSSRLLVYTEYLQQRCHRNHILMPHPQHRYRELTPFGQLVRHRPPDPQNLPGCHQIRAHSQRPGLLCRPHPPYRDRNRTHGVVPRTARLPQEHLNRLHNLTFTVIGNTPWLHTDAMNVYTMTPDVNTRYFVQAKVNSDSLSSNLSRGVEAKPYPINHPWAAAWVPRTGGASSGAGVQHCPQTGVSARWHAVGEGRAE